MNDPAVRRLLGIILIIFALYLAFPIGFRVSHKIVDSGPTPAEERDSRNPDSSKPYRTRTECRYLGGLSIVPYWETIYTDTPDLQQSSCSFIRFDW